MAEQDGRAMLTGSSEPSAVIRSGDWEMADADGLCGVPNSESPACRKSGEVRQAGRREKGKSREERRQRTCSSDFEMSGSGVGADCDLREIHGMADEGLMMEPIRDGTGVMVVT